MFGLVQGSTCMPDYTASLFGYFISFFWTLHGVLVLLRSPCLGETNSRLPGQDP